MGSGFIEGFLKSWGVILASEIGDKTFFIAAILAMRHSRRVVSVCEGNWKGGSTIRTAGRRRRVACAWLDCRLLSRACTTKGFVGGSAVKSIVVCIQQIVAQCC